MEDQTKKPEFDHRFKLLVIGDLGVGKSSLLLRFSENTFSESVPITIGFDFMIRTIELDGETIQFQMWDPPDRDTYHSINTGYYRGVQGIIIVYDLTDQESFSSVPQWLDDIHNLASPDVCIMLLGNKCDLTTERVVDYETAKEHADGLGIPYLETSAKDATNVEQAFIKMAAFLKVRDQGEPPVEMNSCQGCCLI